MNRVAVLGAGTMGSRIAAHLQNAGFQVVLLDRTEELVKTSLETLRGARPPAFYDANDIGKISTGGFDRDLELLENCDWVMEAVAENLDVKQGLLWRAVPFISPSAILSTNTSGLSIAEIALALPDDLRTRWLGVHFFNPPRYMRLVEVIPTAQTGDAALASVRSVVEERLGKTVVIAKDTPNFIANRIGLFALMSAASLMAELRLRVEEVDAWTGPLIGWPATATFRLMDLIGLDVLSQMARNQAASVLDERSDVRFPPFVKELVVRGSLGQKTGAGFYRTNTGESQVLDWTNLEYRVSGKVDVPEHWRALPLRERLPVLLRESAFHARFLPDLWNYAQARIPEIADSADAIDRAMEAGYNWELGPFAMSGKRALPEPASFGIVVHENAAAVLRETADGVGVIAFRTKMNAIDRPVLEFLTKTLAGDTRRFSGFLLDSDAAHFSAGADLQFILASIQQADWAGLRRFIVDFQAMTQAVKYCRVPVVAAPVGLCLGGGAEVAMHAVARQAHAEVSIGLVETNVGLIPGGGGCKEMALLATDGVISWQIAFENIVNARRSGSAAEGRKWGLLRPGDGISMNRDLLRPDAIRLVQRFAASNYVPPQERTDIAAFPECAISREGETDFDRHIAGKVREVFGKGGSERALLEREVEAFLSLCGEAKTAKRIAHTLRTGKPLRN